MTKASQPDVLPTAFFEAVLDTITPAVIALDTEGRVLHWNRCAADLFGRSAASVNGLPFAEFVAETNASRTLLDRLCRLQSTAGEIDVRSASGAEHRLQVHAAPMRNAASDVTGVILQAEPVDERQRGESEQRLLADVGAVFSNSFESEAVLDRVSRLLVPAIADICAFYVLDEEENVHTSATACSSDDLAGIFAEIDLMRRETGPPPTVLAVLRDGESKLFELTAKGRATFARSDRERALLDAANMSSGIITAMRVRGRTIGALSLGRRGEQRFDQRDLRLAEEIARRAAANVDNQRLYEAAVVANKSKSAFLAVISHELRTPLTTIMGYVELMMSGVPEVMPPKATEFLGRVQTAAWHLLGLIEQILIYARLEAGRETLMPETVSIEPLLNDVRALMEPNAFEKGLLFVVDHVEPGLAMVTDLTKLRQILLNLASNAIKFTNEGAVHIGCVQDGANVELYVKDTGIGISAEHLERIFDAFWQVDQSATRRAGGAGLGLSVSRRLARLLGGDMTLASEPGAGTEFVVRLPRAWRPREELASI